MKEKKISEYCEDFLENVGKEYAVYNEVSLQFELGKYIQEQLREDYCVQFERNVYGIFGIDKPKKNEEGKFVKSESDIVVFKKPDIMSETGKKSFPLNSLPEEEELVRKSDELYFIEVKFPRNQAYPRRMWQFLEDIAFCEGLIDEPKVKETVCIAMADKANDGFYKIKKENKDSPYCYFRGENTKEIPTDPTEIETEYISRKTLKFRKGHKICWHPQKDESQYGSFWYYIEYNEK